METFNKTTPPRSLPKNILYIIAIILFLILISFSRTRANTNMWSSDPEYSSMSSELIQSNLKGCGKEYVFLEGIELRSTPLIYAFYKENGFAPGWTSGNELTDQSLSLIELFKDSYKYGIEPSLFNIVELERYREALLSEDDANKSVRMRAGFEFLMTNSAFTFILYIVKGNQYALRRDIFLTGNDLVSGLPAYLSEIKSVDNIEEMILALQPEDPNYSIIQQEMEQIVNFIDLLENTPEMKSSQGTERMYIDIFHYLLSHNEVACTETYSEDEAFGDLVEVQKMLELRPNGKLNFATRSAISLTMHARYAELAYQIEMIRSQS